MGRVGQNCTGEKWVFGGGKRDLRGDRLMKDLEEGGGGGGMKDGELVSVRGASHSTSMIVGDTFRVSF